MITRKMRLSMAMLTIAASVLTTGNIKADEKDTTKETNTATESKYANKAVADIYSTTTLNIRKNGSINAKIVGKMKKGVNNCNCAEEKDLNGQKVKIRKCYRICKKSVSCIWR